MTGRRWRRYTIDESGVRAVWPEPDAGLRLVVDGQDITAADLSLVMVAETPDRLLWRLAGMGVGVDVEAQVVGDNVLTRLAVWGEGHLQHVDVERWQGSPVAGPGLGQPLLGDGWFAALEHPGAEGLGLPVDVDLGRVPGAPFFLPQLVVGSCVPGQELSALWDEVDRVRARPPGLAVLANNWYQLGYLGRMNEETVTAEIAGFGKGPVPLDWYCLDDPWDGEWEAATGLWGRLDPSRFPGGLAALQEACAATTVGPGQGAVGGIGLWVSPWGGYFDRHDFRVAWGREHGFEVQDGSWPRLCPAGDRYGRHLAESMAGFTAAGVRYWKIDGVQFDCAAEDHGHAVGPGGRTDQMDRFAELLDGVREEDRSAVLTFTSGSNPSPWWLRHADFLWRGGLDDDAPEEYDGGRHERFATYIDSCLDALRTTSVPVSSIVAFSLVENGAIAYRNDGEVGNEDAWARHCWLIVGRGTHHHDLYVAPDSLSPREWDVLAAALAWARVNERVLARSRMVGGRPQANEVYGFLSTAADGQAILCLRNPAARPQPVSVDLGCELFDVDVVYGRHLSDVLEPFEVVVLSGRWRPGTRPGPPG